MIICSCLLVNVVVGYNDEDDIYFYDESDDDDGDDDDDGVNVVVFAEYVVSVVVVLLVLQLYLLRQCNTANKHIRQLNAKTKVTSVHTGPDTAALWACLDHKIRHSRQPGSMSESHFQTFNKRSAAVDEIVTESSMSKTHWARRYNKYHSYYSWVDTGSHVTCAAFASTPRTHNQECRSAAWHSCGVDWTSGSLQCPGEDRSRWVPNPAGGRTRRTRAVCGARIARCMCCTCGGQTTVTLPEMFPECSA